MDLRNRFKELLKMCGYAFFSSLHERLDALERQARNASFPETQAALLQASIHTVEKLHELTDHVVIETSDPTFNCPEIGLVEFLYSYLPMRGAVLVGVSDGQVSECLRACGYEVHVLEVDQVIPAADLVMVGFRDRLGSLVSDMRKRGYVWHIVLYRVPGSDKVAYYSNYSRAVPDSWGNVIFFRDYGVFAQAQEWCWAVLPRTYFKPKGRD